MIAIPRLVILFIGIGAVLAFPRNSTLLPPNRLQLVAYNNTAEFEAIINSVSSPSPAFNTTDNLGVSPYNFQSSCTTGERDQITQAIRAARRSATRALNDIADESNNLGPFQAWYGRGGKISFGWRVKHIARQIQEMPESRGEDIQFVCPSEAIAERWPEEYRKYMNYCGETTVASVYHGLFQDKIILCPIFFNRNIHPSTSHCMEVTSGNDWAAETSLTWYQSYTVAHELAHIYLGPLGLSSGSSPPEQYSVDACMRIDP